MFTESLGSWMAVVLPAIATFLGVLLAFWLDRVVERRRQDAAAFWSARHFTRRMAREMTAKPHISLLRSFAERNPPPPIEDVYAQLEEVYPPLAWAWWLAMKDMMRAHERRTLFKNPENRRFKERAERIERELEQAGRWWPPRKRRLENLMDAFGAVKVK